MAPKQEKTPKASGLDGKTADIAAQNPSEGQEKKDRQDLEKSRTEVTDVSKIRLDSERKLNAANNILNVLGTYYATGKSQQLERDLALQEKTLLPGDVIALNTVWITVSGNAEKKEFSLFGSQKTFSTLHELLKTKASALVPTNETARKKLSEEHEKMKKDPFKPISDKLLLTCQMLLSREYKKGPDAAVKFLKHVQNNFPKDAGALKNFGSDGIQFTGKIKSVLFQPFNRYLADSDDPADRKFFESVWSDPKDGMKKLLEESYANIQKGANDILGIALQPFGINSLDDLWKKLAEFFAKYLNPAFMMAGISGQALDKDLEKRKIEKRPEVPENAKAEYDKEKVNGTFSPDAQIQFVSQALSLPKDFYLNYTPPYALHDFYLTLSTDMQLPTERYSPVKDEAFQKNLTEGDVLFTVQTRIEGSGTGPGPLAIVSGEKDGKKMVKYLPTPPEGQTTVSPQEVALDTFLSEQKTGLFAAIRPEKKSAAPVTASAVTAATPPAAASSEAPKTKSES